MNGFDAARYDRDGFAIVRNAILPGDLAIWLTEWKRFYESVLAGGRKPMDPHVEVAEPSPPILQAIHRYPGLLDIAEQVFGPDVALYNQRFIIKDAQSRLGVFFHNDIQYHTGNQRKASAFVALSPCSTLNGALTFVVGSHLTRGAQPNGMQLSTPNLYPGDAVFMNSWTWHGSGPHTAGPDRVLCDVIYQPADDPSSIALLRGQWRTTTFLDNSKRGIK